MCYNKVKLDNGQKPKTLLFDIETSPNLSFNWGFYEQTALDIKQDWHLLSFSAKWLGERKIYTYALPDFKGYKYNKNNDKALVKKLWGFFNEAEIVIAHNAPFDTKKTNARFLIYGLRPPSPYKVLDTLKIARKYFRYDSNKLDELARQLKLGRKLVHTGKDLWFKCMNGDLKAWKLMKKYNAQDVKLLEDLYLRLRPYLENHPHYVGYKVCHACGSPRVIKRGFDRLVGSRKQRYQCQSCGSFSREKE